MRPSLFTLAVLALLAPSALGQSTLLGAYSVQGTNPSASLTGGTPYGGTATIASRQSVLFDVAWSTGAPSSGVGLHLGDHFAAAFGGPACGIALYERDPGTGVLSGRWAQPGGDTYGTERLTPSAEGSTVYAVLGTNPGADKGAAYQGTLALGRRGPTFTARWEVGTSAYEGVGLRLGEHFALAYGGPTCGVAFYEAQPDGTLSGLWTVMGTGQLGRETLRR